nr:hypothetical protein [Crucivirus sp.]
MLVDHFYAAQNITGLSPLHPFGTSATLRNPNAGSTVGGTLQGSTDSYTFPASVSSGVYIITYMCEYDTPGTTGNTIIQNLANCAPYNFFISGSSNEYAVDSTTDVIGWFAIEVTSAGASFQLTNDGTMTNPGEGFDLIVQQIPVNLT